MSEAETWREITEKAIAAQASDIHLSVGAPAFLRVNGVLQRVSESLVSQIFLEKLLAGMFSGIVEPIAGFFTLIAAGFVVPIMPYMLSFAAGAMMYVVVEELIPEMSEGEHSNRGTVAFSIGFVVMMILDVALG